jgi:hypothetical protein
MRYTGDTGVSFLRYLLLVIPMQMEFQSHPLANKDFRKPFIPQAADAFVSII